MPQSDADDRLLAALRGDRVTGETPDEAGELRAAARIGAAARRARNEADAELVSDQFDQIVTSLPPRVETTEEASTRSGEVVPMRRRRRISTWLPSVAAAVIVVVAGAALYFSDDASDQVASIELDPLSGQGLATAELVNDGDRYELRVAVDAIAPDGDYLELWLINPDVTELVSFGPIEEGGVYILPAGLDPAAFPIVDVSVETLDGDPTHSGQSVFRGQFSL